MLYPPTQAGWGRRTTLGQFLGSSHGSNRCEVGAGSGASRAPFGEVLVLQLRGRSQQLFPTPPGPWAEFISTEHGAEQQLRCRLFTSFSLMFFLIFNKFYFLSSLITPTAASRVPLSVGSDCCHCRQSNLTAGDIPAQWLPGSRGRSARNSGGKDTPHSEAEKDWHTQWLHQVPVSEWREFVLLTFN